MNQVIQSLSLFSHPTRIGLWLGMHTGCIAEFDISENAAVGCRWFETFHFDVFADVADKVKPLVRKHYLYNRALSIVLSTPDVIVTRLFDPDKNPQQQDILPPAIDRSSVLWIQSKNIPEILAGMRSSDIEYIRDSLRQTGFIIHSIAPAGIMWQDIFECNSNNVTLECDRGVIQCHDRLPVCIAKEVSQTTEKEAVQITFSCPLREQFTWCPLPAATALESLLPGIEDFNLNPTIFDGAQALKIESAVKKYLEKTLISIAAISAISLLILALAGIWSVTGGSKKSSHSQQIRKILSIKKQNDALEKRIEKANSLYSQRSRAAHALFRLTEISNDSVWFTSVQLKGTHSFETHIQGAALTKQALSDLMSNAEKIAGSRNVRLESSEQITGQNAGKTAGFYAIKELYTFKMVIENL